MIIMGMGIVWILEVPFEILCIWSLYLRLEHNNRESSTWHCIFGSGLTTTNLGLWVQSYLYLFNMTHLGHEKMVVLSRSCIFNNRQIGPLCHNNEVLLKNTHSIFCHMYNLNILSNILTNMQISLMKTTWTWRRN